MKAVLRRASPKDAAATKEADSKVLERGQLRMDEERHTCTWKDHPVTLTVTEFLLLKALASRPGVVKSRNALMDAAYDDQVYVDERTIDSHIKRLRKKLQENDAEFNASQRELPSEWGYLAPAPSFMRTVRLVLLASAVGLTLGAGAVFSWASHQTSEPSVVARTLLRSTEAGSVGANPPAQATQANSPSSTEKRPLTVNSRSADGAANKTSTSSTMPEGTAAVAEAPATTDGLAIAAIAAPATVSREPVLNVASIKKKITKKSNTTWRFASREEPFGLTPGEHHKRRSWGGYYGDRGGSYRNWW